LQPRALWSTVVPVDPGEHVVEASAPGRKTWVTRITLHKSERFEVEVPELEREQSIAPSLENPDVGRPPPSPVRPRSFWTTQRLVGTTMAGIGVVALGVGTALGIDTASTWSDAQAMCPGGRCPDSRGKELGDSAQRTGNLATIFFVAAAALMGGGAALFFTAKSPAPDAAPRPAGML
jgi:hypothetical protein